MKSKANKSCTLRILEDHKTLAFLQLAAFGIFLVTFPITIVFWRWNNIDETWKYKWSGSEVGWIGSQLVCGWALIFFIDFHREAYLIFDCQNWLFKWCSTKPRLRKPIPLRNRVIRHVIGSYFFLSNLVALIAFIGLGDAHGAIWSLLVMILVVGFMVHTEVKARRSSNFRQLFNRESVVMQRIGRNSAAFEMKPETASKDSAEGDSSHEDTEETRDQKPSTPPSVSASDPADTLQETNIDDELEAHFKQVELEENRCTCCRVLGWTYAVIVLLEVGFILAMFAYSTSFILASPQGPGGKFVVSGSSLYLHCEGSGPLTVLVDSDLGSVAAEWKLVRDLVLAQGKARLCNYDRAGYGTSQLRPNPRTSDSIVQDLDELLSTAGEEGPFLLVGQGFGAFNMRLFASKFPEQVAGLLLINPHSPNKVKAYAEANGVTYDTQLKEENAEAEALRAMRLASSIGMPHLFPEAVGYKHPQLPLQDQKLEVASKLQLRFLSAWQSELSHQYSLSADQVLAASPDTAFPFGSLPLVVLSGGALFNGTCQQNHLQSPSSACDKWQTNLPITGPVKYALHQEAASLSSNSTWLIKYDASDLLHIYNATYIAEAISLLL